METSVHSRSRFAVIAATFVSSNIFAFVTPVMAQESTTRAMSFDQCLQVIQQTATNLGVAPVNIVETNILRVVRFVADDGSYLITCSAPDNKMIITQGS
jgi:hypothetical protein